MELITKAPKGTVDIIPGESEKWSLVEAVMTDEAELNGFSEIRTPVFEHTELFLRSVGDTTDVVEKQMYTFEDKGGRSITLRPEGTAGAVRAMLENGLYNGGYPVKLYYKTSCYRYEKPQAGRLRELHQFGVEMFGTAEPAADAQVIAMAMSIFNRLGLADDIEVSINSIGCPTCRAEYRKALRTYFEGYKNQLCETCNSRLERNPMRILDCKSPVCGEIAKGAPKNTDYLCDDCRAHFEKVQTLLKSINIPFSIDPGLVRGLDYYTRTVFEFPSKRFGFALGGGGRYDDLTGIFGMPNMSGVGISFGADRIYDVMTGLGLFPADLGCAARVMFANLGEAEEHASLKLLQEVRAAGIPAEIYPENGKMKKQMEYANRRGIPCVVIVGSRELEERVATIKDMTSGEQTQVPFTRLAEALR